MAIPAARFPALKAQQVLRLLARIGYTQVRQTGSHRKLVAPGRKPIGFSFHNRDDVPPRALRRMLVDLAGLTDEEVDDLI